MLIDRMIFETEARGDVERLEICFSTRYLEIILPKIDPRTYVTSLSESLVLTLLPFSFTSFPF